MVLKKIYEGRSELNLSFINLVEALSKIQARSEVEFELSLIFLYNVFNTHNFNSNATKNTTASNSHSVKRIGVKKRGRVFTKDYTLPSEEILQREEMPDRIEDKRSLLLSRGFEQR
jgi:hypothetical protein